MRPRLRDLGTSLALGVALAGCGGGSANDDGCGTGGQEFVAQASDFAGFMSWFHGVLPPSPLAGIVYPPGVQVGFVNHRTAPGAKCYPTGTIIMKAVENPARDPTNWEVFGFAKRGGNYNAAGAAGWEFFLLRIDHAGNPYITSRGTAPAVDGFDMGTASYTPAGGAGSCNICHGLKDYAATDHIISALMQPGSTLDAGAQGPNLDMIALDDAGYVILDAATAPPDMAATAP